MVEDNPYGLLTFDGDPARALRADAPTDAVVYLGSFSKTLAPGLRVGWVLAPPAVRDRLVLAAESAMLSHSAFAQMTVERYLRTQPWQEQLKAFREMYRERRDAMLDELAATMPADVTWTRPAGGFFVWLTLPSGLDSKAMLSRAIALGSPTCPGPASSPMATAMAMRGCPSASRRQTAFARVLPNWPRSSSLSGSCATRSGKRGERPGASTRPGGRPVTGARGVIAVRQSGRAGVGRRRR